MHNKIRLIAKALVICGLICAFGLQAGKFIIDKRSMSQIQDGKSKVNRAVVEATAQPSMPSFETDCWDRVKYSFAPEIPDAKWTEFKSCREMNGINYTILAADIQKKWDDRWNDKLLMQEINIGEDDNIEGEYSLLSVKIEALGQNKKSEFYANSIYLYIYNTTGEKVDSVEVFTADLDNPLTKSYYRIVLGKENKKEFELVYLIPDKDIEDYCYFLNFNKYSVQPTSKDEIALLKLPLGVEKNADNKK